MGGEVYFPFLYGRRSEFLALRAMLKDHRPLDALVPIVEPVKRNVADLRRCLQEYGKAGKTLAVILNPDKHELKPSAEAKQWRKEIAPLVREQESILPAFRCSSSTTLSQVQDFLDSFGHSSIVLAYSSPALDDSAIKTLAATANVRFHVVLNGKMTAAQQGLLPQAKRVDVRDYFNKLERNSDYAGDELFTDRHKTFKPNWAGFGDYAAIGSAFTPGGGQPAAVAIHAVYKHGSGDLWIEHFVSDDTELEVGSVEDKFIQAAKKLVKASTSAKKTFGSNFALTEYSALVASNHFPGLGTNKVLQIEHHLCLMLDVLHGTV